jgi:SAM-dependent methyltransferase
LSGCEIFRDCPALSAYTLHIRFRSRPSVFLPGERTPYNSWRMPDPPRAFHAEYLAYLAELATVNLHPGGHAATDVLLSTLGLQRAERVLEIGCGTAGTVARSVTAHDVDLTGVDVMPEMLEAANMRLTLLGLRNRVQLVRADATVALPFKSDSHDAVYAESVLGIHPAREAESFLREVFRILKPGGRFCANEGVWKIGTPPGAVSAICERGMADFGLYMASPEGWTVVDWTARMTEAGFAVHSSQLLAGILPGAPVAATGTWRSKLLTSIYQRRWCLSPTLMRRHFKYRRLLKDHAGDGRFLEGRLFVLSKPSQPRDRCREQDE